MSPAAVRYEDYASAEPDCSAGRLLHDELPEALRVLDAGDVEDFLCIKNSRLNAAMLHVL